MTADWWNSAVTFRRCTFEKTTFVLLNLFDLILTLVAIYLGLTELNPFVRFMVDVPALLLLFKVAIPVLIAWIMPGRLLLPSSALLLIVVFWNIRELLVFLI